MTEKKKSIDSSALSNAQKIELTDSSISRIISHIASTNLKKAIKSI